MTINPNCKKCGLKAEITVKRIENKEEVAYCYGCFYDMLTDFAKFAKEKLCDTLRQNQTHTNCRVRYQLSCRHGGTLLVRGAGWDPLPSRDRE